jgi:hypothetical protein
VLLDTNRILAAARSLPIYLDCAVSFLYCTGVFSKVHGGNNSANPASMEDFSHDDRIETGETVLVVPESAPAVGNGRAEPTTGMVGNTSTLNPKV